MSASFVALIMLGFGRNENWVVCFYMMSNNPCDPCCFKIRHMQDFRVESI